MGNSVIDAGVDGAALRKGFWYQAIHAALKAVYLATLSLPPAGRHFPPSKVHPHELRSTTPIRCILPILTPYCFGLEVSSINVAVGQQLSNHMMLCH